jgi:nucleotide-binding universal stress UspA family protein
VTGRGEVAGNPIYSRVVVGFEPDERGEDARALGKLLARTAGGELEEVHVEDGSPGKHLEELAERGEADLIVLGSTHRAHIGAVAPGSVAEHLLHGARARLAIAPRGYAEGDFARDRLRVIAVGFNGTLESQAAVDEAAELAALSASTMRMIAVSAPVPQLGAAAAAQMPPDAAFDLQARVHDAAGKLPAELRVLPVHEKGEPVAKLLERAGEGVDLLVLGSRGFGPVMRLLIGSVSARVIREAPCPVLVVPRPGA